MKCQHEPANSYDLGAWLWSIGAKPEEAESYYDLFVNNESVAFGWKDIDKKYEAECLANPPQPIDPHPWG